MSYQVLARKWRPKNFKELVGQEHVVRALTHALDENRLHHAYLFTGTRGVGKTTIARILAKSLNCEKGISAQPCGQCSACREIDEGRFVDLLEVDAATNTRVEEMRTLLENAVYAPTRGRFKVYVIDEVHMLSTAAFNAMLKTLEEPPEHVKFILATTDPQKIPVTVLSRCLQFNLKQMTVSDTVFQLKRILEKEAIPFEEKALPLIARAGQGSMRDSLSLLDQAIAFGASEVKTEQVAQMLGAIDRDFLFHILRALVEHNPQQLLEITQNLAARALSFSVVLQELGMLLTRLQMLQFAPKSFEDDPEIEKLRELIHQLPQEWVQLAYQIVNIGRREMPLAPDEESGFLMTLLRLYAFRPSEYRPTTTASAKLMMPPAMQATHGNNPAAGTVFQTSSAMHGDVAPKVNRAAEILQQLEESEKKSASSVEKKTTESLKIETPTEQKTTPEPAEELQVAREKEYASSQWQNIVSLLDLSGLGRVLAQNVEVVQLTNCKGIFNVSPKDAAFKGDFAFQNLEKALSNYFQNPQFKLQMREVEPKTLTLAQQKEEKHQAAQVQMQAALDSDPFVQGLKQEFSALIDWDSVRAVS